MAELPFGLGNSEKWRTLGRRDHQSGRHIKLGERRSFEDTPIGAIIREKFVQVFVRWEEATVLWRLMKGCEWDDFCEHMEDAWGDKQWKAEFRGQPWIGASRTPENNATVTIVLSLDGCKEEVRVCGPGNWSILLYTGDAWDWLNRCGLKRDQILCNEEAGNETIQEMAKHLRCWPIR
jgi:hypothetical protein